jgi:hypothetical protein
MNSSLKIALNAKDTPQVADPLATSTASVAFTKNLAFPDANILWAARIKFSGDDQTAVVDLMNGTIVLSANGVRQIESAAITAASGATSSGNLALTLTSARVAGSPLAISVPLVTGTHTTATLIAAAIAAKLAATAAVAAYFDVTALDGDVILTSKLGYANDTTLNLAITAGLGVSAVTSSSNNTAGVAGPLIERRGGDGNNAFGENLLELTANHVLIMSATGVDGDSIDIFDDGSSAVAWPSLKPGRTQILVDEGANIEPDLRFVSNGNPVLDIIILGEGSN